MTVVYLHPVALDGECWSLTGLKGEFFTYPGHGGRALPSGGLRLESIADEVAATYEGPLDLVGVSMGSHVAQYLAARYPGRVHSMVLTAGGRRTAPPEPGDDPRATEMLRLGTAGTLDWALQRWFTRDALAMQNHAGVAYVRRRWLANDPVAVAAGWNALRQSTIRSQAPKISVPVTVVACTRDHTQGKEDEPLYEARELVGLIPGSELAVVEGPHLVQLECPQDYAAVVTRHLKRVGSL